VGQLLRPRRAEVWRRLNGCGRFNRISPGLIDEPMTVYIVAQLKFTREELYRRYQAHFFHVFKQFNGRVLVADEAPIVLEGEWPNDKVVVIEFPDRAEAERFIQSPAYVEISKDRVAGAETISLLVKGV
jgi:uncharacterized protein (DUF1330 family)